MIDFIDYIVLAAPWGSLLWGGAAGLVVAIVTSRSGYVVGYHKGYAACRTDIYKQREAPRPTTSFHRMTR